jgi:hypothetical protein
MIVVGDFILFVCAAALGPSIWSQIGCFVLEFLKSFLGLQIEVLREVLDVASKNKVDMFTISGDLFESEEDAEALRPSSEVRCCIKMLI